MTHREVLKGADIGLSCAQRVCINVERQAVRAAQQGRPNAQHALHTAQRLSTSAAEAPDGIRLAREPLGNLKDYDPSEFHHASQPDTDAGAWNEAERWRWGRTVPQPRSMTVLPSNSLYMLSTC